MGIKLMTLLPQALLLTLLALAVWHDVRSRRIPNPLVFGGALLGVLLQTLAPQGAGLWSALAGLALGLLLLLPMYSLRAMGAGDVKLLAMIGAFLGPQQIVGVFLASLLAGGVLAIVVSLWRGSLRAMLANSYQMMLHSVIGAMAGQDHQVAEPAAPSGRLPYAVAIAAGALPFILLPRFQSWTPF